jgi:hypothetical protein
MGFWRCTRYSCSYRLYIYIYLTGEKALTRQLIISTLSWLRLPQNHLIKWKQNKVNQKIKCSLSGLLIEGILFIVGYRFCVVIRIDRVGTNI